jgi:hypothetical protein
MSRRPLTALLALAALTGLLAACGGDSVLGVKPKLVVREDTPVDAAGHYRLDFGDVLVGASRRLPVFVENRGRSELTLQPVLASAPFTSDLTGSSRLPMSGSQEIGFTFTPAAVGPATVTAQLSSNGGEASIILIGNGLPGIQPPVQTCTFEVRPANVDFGNVAKGQSKAGGTQFANTGTGENTRCVVSQVALEPGTAAAFTLTTPAPGSQEFSAGGVLPIGVVFAPTQTSLSLDGKITLQVGPPGGVAQAVEVPLHGTSIESCPNPQPDGSCPVAMESIYLNDRRALYSFDTVSRATHYLGDFAAPGVALFQMYDIGIDAKGLLVGISDSSLFTINPNTAACALLANVPKTAAGLTFLPDGRIAIAGEQVDLFDLSTRQMTNLVPAGKYSTSGDIVGLPDGLLYWTVNGKGATDLLVTIDPATGATTEIGDIGFGSVWGLSFARGVLYGFTADGRVLTIDAKTAKAQAQPLSGNWYGAATNPTRWQ